MGPSDRLGGPRQVDPDLGPILHEEIDRLPESRRLPVVLCDLEGLTYEQAAERLRWTVPTVRHRLADARRRLKARLARRGLAAPAFGPLMAAPAKLSAALARSTILAATGGPASAAPALIARTLLKGMLDDAAQDRRDRRPRLAGPRLGGDPRRRRRETRGPSRSAPGADRPGSRTGRADPGPRAAAGRDRRGPGAGRRARWPGRPRRHRRGRRPGGRGADPTFDHRRRRRPVRPSALSPGPGRAAGRSGRDPLDRRRGPGLRGRLDRPGPPARPPGRAGRPARPARPGRSKGGSSTSKAGPSPASGSNRSGSCSIRSATSGAGSPGPGAGP